MDSKVVSLLPRKKKATLSRLMIVTLVEATVKQNRGIPIGPVDIRGGSFGALIERGLIVRQEVITQNQVQWLWQVTPEAIEILKDYGVNVMDL